MSTLTPEHRSLRAQIAAAERWGRTADRTAATEPARAGLRAKYAREIDPEGKLDKVELERRVDSLMKAHMLRMSLAAKNARARAREADEAARELAALTQGGARASA